MQAVTTDTRKARNIHDSSRKKICISFSKYEKEPAKYLRDTSQLKCNSGFWWDREIKSIKASENSATIWIESGQW